MEIYTWINEQLSWQGVACFTHKWHWYNIGNYIFYLQGLVQLVSNNKKHTGATSRRSYPKKQCWQKPTTLINIKAISNQNNNLIGVVRRSCQRRCSRLNSPCRPVTEHSHIRKKKHFFLSLCLQLVLAQNQWVRGFYYKKLIWFMGRFLRRPHW